MVGALARKPKGGGMWAGLVRYVGVPWYVWYQVGEVALKSPQPKDTKSSLIHGNQERIKSVRV